MNWSVSFASSLRLGVAGAHLGVRRQDLADLLDELRGRDPRLRGGADLVELALLAEQPLRRREIEARERRAADRAHRPELDEAGDPELLERAFDLHADRLARTFRSFLSAVDLSTTTSFGPGHAPCTSVRLLNCGFVGSTENPRFGAPPKAIVLPSLTSWVLSLETPPIASRTSGSARTFGEQRLVERRLRRSVVADVERRLRRDRGVRVPVDVREDRVERLVDRVGEHERAAHRRDAEDDRDRGERRAELPRQKPLERERGHMAAISSIASPISCCEAPESSRTMRPSAR